MNTKARSKPARLGLGTVQFGMRYGFTKAKTQPEVDAILDAAARSNVRWVDTAPVYGDSESKIGRYFKHRSTAGWTLATKLPHLTASQASSQQTVETHFARSLKRSARRLGVPTIEWAQLHQTEPGIFKSRAVWSALKTLRRERLFDKLGISVYSPGDMSWALTNHADIIRAAQLPYNLFDRRFEPLMKKWGGRIRLIVRSAFLKGVIPAPIERLPSELAGLKGPKAELGRIAERFDTRPEVLALLFAATAPGASIVLIGVDDAAELRECAAALRKAGAFAPIRRALKDLAVRETRLIDPRRWRSL